MQLIKRICIAGIIIAASLTTGYVQGAAETPEVRITTGVKGNQTVRGISLSRSGNFGVLATLEHFTVIQMKTGLTVAEIPADGSWVVATAIDPHERFIVSVGSTGAKLWSFPDLAFQKNLVGSDFQDVKVSSDGAYVAAGDFAGNLYVWSTADWSLHRSIKTKGPIGALAISANGSVVVTGQGYKDQRPRAEPEGTTENEIVAWNVRDGTLLWSVAAHRNDIAALEFVDSDRKLLSGASSSSVGVSLGSTLRQWDAGTGKLISDFANFRQEVTDLTVVASDTRRIYGVTRADAQTTRIVSIPLDRESVDTVCPEKSVAIDRLAVSSDGGIALGIARWGASLVTWDAFPDCRKAKSVGLPEMTQQPRRTYVDSEKLLVLSYNDRLLGLDLKASKIRFSVPFPNHDLRDVQRGPQEGQLLVLAGSTLAIHNSVSGAQEERFGLNPSHRQYGRIFPIDKTRVAISLEDSSVRLPGHSGSGTGQLIVFDMSRRAETVVSPVIHDDDIVALAALPERNLLITGSWDGSVKGIDINTLTVVTTYRSQKGRQITSVARSPTKEEFVATWIYTPDGSGTVGKWNVGSERPLWTAGKFEGFYTAEYSQNGSQILVGGKELLLLSSADGSTHVQYRGIPPGQSITLASFVDPGALILTATLSGNMFVWPADGGGAGPLAEILVTPSQWFVYSENRFDISSFDTLGSVGWIVSDAPLRPLAPEIFMRDYYQPRLLSQLLACREAEMAKSGSCAETFKQLPSVAVLNRVQPNVQITNVRQGASPELALVDVEVSGAEDPSQRNGKTRTDVYDVRLFRQGQLAGQWPASAQSGAETDDKLTWRSNRKVPIPDGQHSAVHTFEVRLAIGDAGKPVSFAAYAFNEDRVKSETARYDKFVVPADSSVRHPRAFVISIGVNTYRTKNLSFAAKDAVDLSTALGQLRGYEVVPITLVSDVAHGVGRDAVPATNFATKENIRAVLEVLAEGERKQGRFPKEIGPIEKLRQATPDDLVIISFSGHGYAAPSGRFYLLPSGTDSREINANSLAKMISSEELSGWLRKVDAGDIVLLVDACHSAASVDTPGFKPGPMGDPGLGQLAYDKGLRILAATQADDVAIESEKVGQGLLTFALIQDGLRSKDLRGKWKADLDGDGTVTLGEWLKYGEQRVPSLYDEIRTGKLQLRDSYPDPLFKQRVVRRAQTPALFDFHRRSAEVAVQ
ncbi:caspase family protein [Bradyrhizobium sp. AZCC 2230]|uniref:caspase family protein n=1 Tax=Bradyrhizobium sp. AZCC 2230 TaxID=3117021 RepID=UPI002FF31935